MKKVLLVEDFPVIQELYSDYLEDHGYSVDVVSNGKIALEKVKITEYDFILLDLLLPEINGIEFLEKYTERAEGLKILVLSDFNKEETYNRAFELGVDDYLIKAENTPSELLEKLNKYA